MYEHQNNCFIRLQQEIKIYKNQHQSTVQHGEALDQVKAEANAAEKKAKAEADALKALKIEADARAETLREDLAASQKQAKTVLERQKTHYENR